MKKLLKITIISLIAGTLLISGCTTTDTISAAQIKANALQSAANVTSYRFSLTGTMEATIGNDTESFTENVSLTLSGAVDLSNEKAMIDIEVTRVDEDAGQSVEEQILIYIINTILYTGGDTWVKQNVTDFDSIFQLFSGSQYIRADMEMQRLLLETATVAKLNDEAVNGVNCYVLQIEEPDLEQLFDLILGQEAIGSAENLSEILKGWTIKQWIAKDTSYLTKAYNKVTIELIEMDLFFGYSMNMEMDVTILFSDYNEAINIELPEEAENASWLET
jgi:hypothetical protein